VKGWKSRAERHSEGLERFLDVYQDARYLPYSLPDSELMAALEKCLNCGTCLGACPVVGAAVGHPYPGPRTVGTSLARSVPDCWTAADLVAPPAWPVRRPARATCPPTGPSS